MEVDFSTSIFKLWSRGGVVLLPRGITGSVISDDAKIQLFSNMQGF